MACDADGIGIGFATEARTGELETIGEGRKAWREGNVHGISRSLRVSQNRCVDALLTVGNRGINYAGIQRGGESRAAGSIGHQMIAVREVHGDARS